MKTNSKRLVTLFGLCTAFGIIVSKSEKKKGWSNSHTPYGLYEKHIKRPLDLVLSLIALFFLWPIMLVLDCSVKKNIGLPVIFKQVRPGLGEKLFTLRKYRTMTDEKGTDGELLSDKERLTPFGKKLRSSSLDELPELISIITGDMAIVGPRPQLVRDMVFMSDKHRKRHTVRPGLTGLAQVSGRNAISWEEKLDKDLEYIDHITFIGDMKIIMKTVWKVIRKDGITEEGQATALDYGDWLLENGRVSSKEYDTLQKEARKIIEEAAEKLHKRRCIYIDESKCD